MTWVLVIWLVLPNFQLGEPQKEVFQTKEECLKAATEIVIPEKSWVAICRQENDV